MKNISEIDKNFCICSDIPMEDTQFYNVKEHPFCLFGLSFDTKFRRMPENVAKKINSGTYELHTNTSGGRLRFITDSPYIALVTKMPVIPGFIHMPKTGSSGFDIYSEGIFRGIIMPPFDAVDGYSGICRMNDGTMREYTVNFPLYNDVEEVFIGLKKGSAFKEPTPFASDNKILFYGSSITQGGCVSRPGLCYPDIIANKFGCDIVNLGFSGSAFGELAMANHIASTEHSIFVMDYDHNAPTAEHLAETHEKFFQYYRSLRPTTPVVIISAPNILFGGETYRVRREIVKKTYENAIAAGDRNVYFVDGETLWGTHWDMCTVDRLHPNDLGHYGMAIKIGDVIKELL